MRDITLLEMLKKGVHFGHKESRWHPKMRPYVYTVRQGIHIINLEKTAELLRLAYDFIKDQASQGKVIMFVGTKRQAQKLIVDAATRVGMPYVTERWLGGTLTNFVTISKLIKKLKEYRKAKETGDLEKYTKKEKLKFEKESEKLERLIGGIENLAKLPDVIFIADIKQDPIVVQEAQKMNIPRVAIVDSNANPDLVDYPIPANDDAVMSLDFLITLMVEAIEEGKKMVITKKKTEDAPAPDSKAKIPATDSKK